MLSYKNIWEVRFILTPLWKRVMTTGINFIFYANTHMHVCTLYYNNLLVFLLKGILVCILKNLILYLFIHLPLMDHLAHLTPFNSEW